jgi:hypothetical protein
VTAQRIGGESGAVGVGAGTGLLYLAESLHADFAWAKPIILYSAPAFAVCVRYCWLIIKLRLHRWGTKREIKAALQDMRNERDTARNDPDCSPAHLAELQKNVENLQKLLAASLKENVVLVGEALRSLA